MEAGALIFAALLAAAAWFWHDSMRSREAAELLAKDWCQARGWQLLDGTVALVSLSPARCGGALCIRRHYEFAHTRGDSARHFGLIVMAGGKLENLVLPDDTIH